MDFGLYPLDVQRCPVDFSSYKYTLREMTFRWRDDPPLSFPSDFDDGYRLPKYVVNFIADPEMQIIYYGEGNHSTARLMIDLSREIRSHLLETYLPSSLFVIMSWGGFVVIPEVVPGRMVLLVTTLLSLVTMFDTVRNNSPNALELKCIEVWLISCILFVFFALLEYFVVLFGIRYEKHWQKKKEGDDGCNGNHVNHVAPRRTENLRLFHPKVFPHQDGVDLKDRRTNMMHESYETTSSESSSEPTVSRRERARQIRDRCFLFCGSQQGTLDKISLALFPICFVIFNLAYWVSYIAEARRRMQSDT